MFAQVVQTAFRPEHWAERLNAEHLIMRSVQSQPWRIGAGKVAATARQGRRVRKMHRSFGGLEVPGPAPACPQPPLSPWQFPASRATWLAMQALYFFTIIVADTKSNNRAYLSSDDSLIDLTIAQQRLDVSQATFFLARCVFCIPSVKNLHVRPSATEDVLEAIQTCPTLLARTLLKRLRLAADLATK